MDERKVIRNGRAFGVNEVKTNVYYIDRNYNLECYSKNRITKTGLLEVAVLNPKKKSLPEFRFRWDEKADALDVDILNVPNVDKKSFNKGMNGYIGHRTKRVGKDKIFKVFIKIPDGIIFDGLITSPLHRELELIGHIGFKASTKGVWMDKEGNIKRIDLG